MSQKSNYIPLSRAVELIKAGNVVSFPTETVYGLGADAFNSDAIDNVFTVKGRPSDNPLIVHVASLDDLTKIADSISNDTQKLMNHFWPGPLTLVIPKKKSVLDRITAGLPTVAIRMPNHPLAMELIRQTGPLVAPSANLSGKPSPTRPEHLFDDYGGDIPVLDGGICQVGIESTVINMTTQPYLILRPGSISKETIQEIVKKPVEYADLKDNNLVSASPGIKYSHYSPDAKVMWLSEEFPSDFNNVLILAHDGRLRGKRIVNYNMDFELFARDLYDRFRMADRDGIEKIYVQRFDVEVSPLVTALKNRLDKVILE